MFWDRNHHGLVIRADGERSLSAFAPLPILLVYAAKTGEGIETDNLAMAVEGFIDSAQGGQNRQVLPPAHSEFHDDTVSFENESIDVMKKKQSGEILACQKKPEVGQQFVLR